MTAGLRLGLEFGSGIGSWLEIRIKVRVRFRVANSSIQTAGEGDKMRINHVIKTDQWRCAPQISPALHFVVSQNCFLNIIAIIYITTCRDNIDIVYNHVNAVTNISCITLVSISWLVDRHFAR